ncbi:MAG: hypothetical protein EKK37_00565 [Sphingobacteriales bacterium]|nr:MAG: hypothetical protein EKK37_00565 [Sphingobacteriales bacterium]
MRLRVFIILFLIYGCKTISIQTNPNELTGLWKLVTVEKKDTSGRWQEDSWMKNGTGYIMYDGRGHMAVQMAPEGYKNFSWLSERDNTNPGLVKSKLDSLSMEELKLLISKFSSHQAYFANYKISGDSVIIHNRISNSNPSAWNATVQRTFAVKRDTLILQLPDGFRRLIWIKQK